MIIERKQMDLMTTNYNAGRSISVISKLASGMSEGPAVMDGEDVRRLIESDASRDLHIHTCYSDGALTPEEVVDRWRADGYDLIAVTDHDGIEGSMIAYDYALGRGITVIPGIEFDSADELGRDLHMLGYGIDYYNDRLRDVLLDIILKRARRNDALMKALNDMGAGITLDDIGEINEGRYVGKPTFAQILYKKGMTKSPQEAFNTIFRDDSIRRVRKETLTTAEVIDVIHEAGGLAVLAHPMEQRHLGEPWEDFLPRLMTILDRMTGYGIDGIECHHPSADEEQAGLLREYAEDHGLVFTRGSDFHADNNRRDFSRYHI